MSMLLTPPLTPDAYGSSTATDAATRPIRYARRSPRLNSSKQHVQADADVSPDFILPPPVEPVPLVLPEPSLPYDLPVKVQPEHGESEKDGDEEEGEWQWSPGMSLDQRDKREAWLAGGRGRRGLRIVIVTENFLPCINGVSRTLARLLEHLQKEGHQCMLLGPDTGMSTYSGHPLVGTAGVPLVVYPGLKLNFLRPKFMRVIKDFQPDVVHFVDPIWLGAQTLMAMELGWAGEDWVSEQGPALGAGISGAIVASYHTNLATYARLFGWQWLEPIMWKLQQWLYSKTLITLCPSPSTTEMLHSQRFQNVRLWPRGVDLSQFGPHRRSAKLRASWGVGDAPITSNLARHTSTTKSAEVGTHWQGRKASLGLPMTPPMTPEVFAAGEGHPTSEPEPMSTASDEHAERVVLLYVGRISWEKNLHLLLHAYPHIASRPKLVFVGDGPARVELEQICRKEGYDAVFMGHRVGQELAECFASADVFAFPSFTETFGQVVLEAMASGLPVIGLDAEGTRDLVSHAQTGLLLPQPSCDWSTACQRTSPHFPSLTRQYGELLSRACTSHAERAQMGHRACTEGIKGYTWWDAMERCVDGYRESLRMARDRRQVEVITALPPNSASPGKTTGRISRVNRVVSKRLVPKVERDLREGIWHLKTALKIVLALLAFWYIYSRHVAGTLARVEHGVHSQ